MSGSFEGFSEADILKITGNKQEKEEFNNLCSKPLPTGKKLKTSKNNLNKKTSRNKHYLNSMIENSSCEPIAENAKLDKDVSKENQYKSLDLINEINCESITNIITTELNLTDNSSELHERACQDKIENKEPLVERKRNLDEFQAKQKLMEEQNRKRKELLAKVLAVKTKQTKEEAQRLNEINDELKKLDLLLSNDVNLLRKQIEIASVDFMEAEKQYFRIEKEFLESKLNLHKKLERKDMLTEHLCAIIEKNEERKADKLNELLIKLNLNTHVEINN